MTGHTFRTTYAKRTKARIVSTNESPTRLLLVPLDDIVVFPT